MPRSRRFDSYRARDLISTSAAATTFGAFLFYYGFLCFRQAWAADFQMYCAGVTRLYTSFSNPGHEAIAVGNEQSSVYTPYLVAVAAFGKALAITPYRALQIAGVVNLVLYACAVWYFFSRYSIHYRYGLAAACFLWVTLVLRWENYGWSSETSLATFQFIQAYPSTLGWSLALISFGLLEDLRREPRWRRLLALSAVLSCLLLNHILTASWAIGIIAVLVVGRGLTHGDRRLVPRAAAAVALAAALVPLWPYNSFYEQTAIGGIEEPSTFGAQPFGDLVNLYVVALPCAWWLLFRVRQHGVWCWTFVATYAALCLWKYLGISFGNRYSLFMGFPAQFLVAETVAMGLLVLTRAQPSLRPAFALRVSDKRFVSLACVVALIAALPSPMLAAAASRESLVGLKAPSSLLHGPSPHDTYYSRYAGLRPFLSSGDIVMMPTSRDAFDIAATTGARFVSAPGAIRVRDFRQRFQAVTSYFHPGAGSASRALLLERYQVTKVIVPAYYSALLPPLSQELGPALYQDQRLALFQVPVKLT